MNNFYRFSSYYILIYAHYGWSNHHHHHSNCEKKTCIVFWLIILFAKLNCPLGQNHSLYRMKMVMKNA